MQSDGHPDRSLTSVLEQVTRLVRQLATAGELSLTAAMVLARLTRDGPQRLTDLAAGEGLSQPGMTQLIGRLERDGLVRRTASTADRRGVLVAVTGAGRALVERRRAERAAALHELLGRLDAEDQAAIAGALPALARLVEARARTA
ncbi:MAG TPA: MarR family transcriptional regulator [Actinoplanes sp.]|jgi:DNA-binding MarR family transcriptional regulator|nr:MarR family transcriptional regulator [Actinoplanes sp.]